MTHNLEVGMDFTLEIHGVEIGLARDISFDITRNEISTNFRGGNGWNIKKSGFGEWSASFDIVYDATNVGWQEIRDAFLNRTEVAFKSEDKQGNYFAGMGYVTGFSQGEPLEEFATNSITFIGKSRPLLNPLPDPNPHGYLSIGTGVEGALF